MSPAADHALCELDLNEPGLFADGPPHGLFARMRAEALARLELRICLTETLRRMPDTAPAGPAGRFPHNTFH